MKIDFQSNSPVFQQIADAVRSAVAAGVYRPGEALPSIRVMALELLVNPNTVKRAYEQLERDGLVASRQGAGVFVSERGAVAAARSGAEKQVVEAFSQGVAAGAAADLTRRRVDQLYERAWETTRAAPSSSGKANGSKP